MTKNNNKDDFVMALAGNKCDTEPGERRVTKDQAIDYSRNHGMEYQETSAKTGEGVRELFGRIAQRIADQMQWTWKYIKIIQFK